MPHFGLMNEDELGPIEGPLMRAKLHIRCGRRRLFEGKIPMGIITLYDALNSAMQWYIADPERLKVLHTMKGEDMRNDKSVYEVLTRSRVLDGSFDYGEFEKLVDTALTEEMTAYDYQEFLKSLESVMIQLGVMPFDEDALPPEDPSTF
ncbi:MAG: hypothetical protein AMK70_11500 [Nitrospira bacterium SG8_35_1]|nr:MAG: hypothetical protein AMK70_11500 [Nitrospira bacterium SG8_35_1]UCH43953.1 MAG: hypothetical protein JSV11_06445 [Nitrospiraceae bacterium]